MRKRLWLGGLLGLLHCALPAAAPGYSASAEMAAEARDKTYQDELTEKIGAAIAAKDFGVLNTLEADLVKSQEMSLIGRRWLEYYYGTLFSRLEEGIDRKTECKANLETFTREWMHATPSSPAAFIAHADMRMYQGWCFRGESVASSVKQEDWPRFYEGLKDALVTLGDAEKFARTDPHYHVVLLETLNDIGASNRQFTKAFDAAVKLDPYYVATYRAASRYYLARWHGNVLAYEAFAKRAAALTPRYGDRLYAEAALWNVDYLETDVINPGFDWERVKKGGREYLARFPSREGGRVFMEASCRLGDIEGGRQFIRDLFRGEPDAALRGWFGTCDMLARRAGEARKARDARLAGQ